jgi:rhamnose utilization protein RhaD (predicted bifunctional aldolase and dehydrogenase)
MYSFIKDFIIQANTKYTHTELERLIRNEFAAIKYDGTELVHKPYMAEIYETELGNVLGELCKAKPWCTRIILYLKNGLAIAAGEQGNCPRFVEEQRCVGWQAFFDEQKLRSQTTKQPATQTAEQTAEQSATQTTTQSATQTTEQSATQTTKQTAEQSATQTTEQSANDATFPKICANLGFLYPDPSLFLGTETLTTHDGAKYQQTTKAICLNKERNYAYLSLAPIKYDEVIGYVRYVTR